MRFRLFILLCLLPIAVSCSSNRDIEECTRILGECAELGTVEYTCDLMFQNKPDKFEAVKPGPRIILYSAKVHVKAGIKLDDASKISVSISPDGKNAVVTLPRPVILDCKMEPKDVNKEFEKIGVFRWKFTNEEKLAIRQRAEQELKEQLQGPDPRIPILKDAEKNARAEVELLLKAAKHFDNVNVIFENDEKTR